MIVPVFDVSPAATSAPASADVLVAELRACQLFSAPLLACGELVAQSVDDTVNATEQLLTTFAGRCHVLVPTDDAGDIVGSARRLLDAGAAKVVLHVPRVPSARAAVLDCVRALPCARVIALLAVIDETCSNEKDIVDQILLLNTIGVAGYSLYWPLSVPPFEESASSSSISPKNQFVRQVFLAALKHILNAVRKESSPQSASSLSSLMGRGDVPAVNRSVSLMLSGVSASSLLISQLDKIGIDLLVDRTALDLTKSHTPDLKLATTSSALLLNTTLSTSTLLDPGKCVAAVLTSDRSDGLFPTIVVDEQGVVLGLVYSSVESLSECIRTGTGVYHSRTRGLWYKGLTSGATQEVIRLDLDCDRDTIRCMVCQHGPGFCHLGCRTCFGQDYGLSALASTLQRHKLQFSQLSTSAAAIAAPLSYIHNLFIDPALLNSKILEDANKLANADPANSFDIASETANVIYFALVKAFACGLTLADVEEQLNIRALKVTRRKLNQKVNSFHFFLSSVIISLILHSNTCLTGYYLYQKYYKH